MNKEDQEFFNKVRTNKKKIDKIKLPFGFEYRGWLVLVTGISNSNRTLVRCTEDLSHARSYHDFLFSFERLFKRSQLKRGIEECKESIDYFNDIIKVTGVINE